MSDVFEGGLAPTVGDVELCFTGFAVGDSATWLDPMWSAEHITSDSASAGESTPRNGTYHVCTGLPPEDQSTPNDYTGSGYDRGHMTPAGDRGADKPETFGMCNMVPQTPNLNRKVWAGIEASLRDMATGGAELYVVTGPEVVTGYQTLNGRVAVPAKTWKAVYVVGQGAGAWVCTNTRAPQCSQESISALVGEIGFDPFPALDRDVKAKVIPIPPPTKSASGGVRLPLD